MGYIIYFKSSPFPLDFFKSVFMESALKRYKAMSVARVESRVTSSLVCSLTQII